MDNPTVGIIYKLADGKRIRIDVTIEVKELLEQSDRQIRSQRRKDRRYLDFVGGVNELEAIAPLHEDTADLVSSMVDCKWLYAAICKLPEPQKRRVRLYYFEGLTYRCIGESEGVGFTAAIQSVKLALKTLRKQYTEQHSK